MKYVERGTFNLKEERNGRLIGKKEFFSVRAHLYYNTRIIRNIQVISDSLTEKIILELPFFPGKGGNKLILKYQNVVLLVNSTLVNQFLLMGVKNTPMWAMPL